MSIMLDSHRASSRPVDKKTVRDANRPVGWLKGPVESDNAPLNCFPDFYPADYSSGTIMIVAGDRHYAGTRPRPILELRRAIVNGAASTTPKMRNERGTDGAPEAPAAAFVGSRPPGATCALLYLICGSVCPPSVDKLSYGFTINTVN